MSNLDKVQTITIIGSGAGGGYTGDEAMLLGIVRSLRSEMPNARITVLCKDPDYIQTTYNIETIRPLKRDVYGIRRALKILNNADLLIRGGGIPLSDSGHLRRLFEHGLIRLLRKPVMYYGVGVLPIKSRVGKLVTRCVMNWSSVITVRDESSMGFLWQLKLRKNIIRTADLSLLLEPVLSERVEKKLEEISGTPKKAPLIGICVGNSFDYRGRWWREVNLSPVPVEVMRNLKVTLARVADFIATELGQVLFIPMWIPPQTSFNDDSAMFRDITALMKRRGKMKVLNGARYTAQEVAGLMGRLDLLLSGRLHGLIYAALSSVPQVAIGWGMRGHSLNKRIHDFMESIGQGNLVCEMEDFDYNDCISKLNYAWSYRDAIRQEITLKKEALKERAALNAKLAKELLL